MSFSSLGLIEPIVRAVTELGYTQPTPIQAQAIPAVLSGGDLLAGAQTGTGKTAGFALPILQRLSATPARKRGAIRALILTPTRELAAQIHENVRDYGAHLPLRSNVIFGGVNINPQLRALRAGVDILVATPGRLLDHVQQKSIDLSSVEILVLDEADRMLDMGFIHDIKRVLALLPRQRQNLLFSATFSDDIKRLADSLLNKPALIEVARRNAPIELVTQRVMHVDQKAKRHLLAHLIREQAWFQVLVFTRTKHGANRLAEQLTKGGINAMAIHGNKSQNARTRALAEFKSGDLQVLVATDIAARGLDIAELPHVVNFELPNVPEDYVHRIGRTGRAGCTGEALSLVAPDEKAFLAGIEKLTRQKIEQLPLPAFEIPKVAEQEERARPAPQGRGRQPSAGARRNESAAPRSRPTGSGQDRREASRAVPAGDKAGKAQQRRKAAATPGAKPAAKPVADRGPRREGQANGGDRRNGAASGKPRTADSRTRRDTSGDNRRASADAPRRKAEEKQGTPTATPSGGLRGVFSRSLNALARLGKN